MFCRNEDLLERRDLLQNRFDGELNFYFISSALHALACLVSFCIICSIVFICMLIFFFFTSVCLRQNPHNVDHWLRRVKLYKDQPNEASEIEFLLMTFAYWQHFPDVCLWNRCLMRYKSFDLPIQIKMLTDSIALEGWTNYVKFTNSSTDHQDVHAGSGNHQPKRGFWKAVPRLDGLRSFLWKCRTDWWGLLMLFIQPLKRIITNY